jgi:hypothetical protein
VSGPDDDEEAPGWDAIDAAFEHLYPGRAPHHWGTDFAARVMLGGPEALDGLSAYRADEPVPHWHWVTYGLTELYDKDSEDAEWSGWGYELTMRVPRDAELPAPWPIALLQQIANWAHHAKRLLQAGEAFDTGSPIVPDEEGATLTGIGFLADPELPQIETPHGRVDFVQMVGLHPLEIAHWREHGAESFLERAGRPHPSQLNVPSRESLVQPG